MDLLFLSAFIPVFSALIAVRLFYIEKEADKQLSIYTTVLDKRDKDIQSEIKKTTPTKEAVLSLASEMSAHEITCSDIKNHSIKNRYSVWYDIISILCIAGIIIVDYSVAPEQSLVNGVMIIPIGILIVTGASSLFRFAYSFNWSNRIKNKTLNQDLSGSSSSW